MMRRAVRSSSSTNRPSGMMPALLTSMSSGPSCSSAPSKNLENDSRSVTSSPSATVLAVGGASDLCRSLLSRPQVDVADRHPHALAQTRLRDYTADAARAAGDRGGLSGEDTGLLGHESPPGVLAMCPARCRRMKVSSKPSARHDRV